MTTGGEGWRVLDRAAYCWFEAPSHATGAALVADIASSGADLPDIDLRPSGARIRLDRHDETAAHRSLAISTRARELGLVADPSVLQVVGLAIDATDATALLPFWRTTLAYRQDGDVHLRDPLRRDPSIEFHPDDETRPRRNRLHVDVGRPSEEVATAVAELRQTPSGPYGLMVSDAAGNEVDLVPGGPVTDDPDTADWRAPFAAMVFYPTSSPEQASRLVTAVAELADNAGIPLLIDIRGEGVMIDSGKDLWEGDEGPLPTFTVLAAEIQAAARDIGLAAHPSRPRFVQVALDLVGLDAVRGFWMSVLGYEPDSREGVVDIFDPRRLNPVLIFQRMDEADEDRRRQRDRMRLVLHVPDDQLQRRIDMGVAAGGRVVTAAAGLTRLADPEGNELDLVTSR